MLPTDTAMHGAVRKWQKPTWQTTHRVQHAGATVYIGTHLVQ